MGLHLQPSHTPQVGGRGPVGPHAFISTEKHLRLGSAGTTHLDNQKVGTRGGKIFMRSNRDISTKETKREREKVASGPTTAPLVPFPSTESDISYVCRYHGARIFMLRSNSLRS